LQFSTSLTSPVQSLFGFFDTLAHYARIGPMSRPRIVCVLLALVTLLVYLPVRHYAFVDFDDPVYVTDKGVPDLRPTLSRGGFGLRADWPRFGLWNFAGHRW
jgi:hypothetical protein